MTFYSPDEWILLDYTDSSDPHYRIYAVWDSWANSWRVNSGIVSVTEDEGFYYFRGYTNSTYKCDKKTYGIKNNYGNYVLESFRVKSQGKIKPINEMPDIMKMNWILKDPNKSQD